MLYRRAYQCVCGAQFQQCSVSPLQLLFLPACLNEPRIWCRLHSTIRSCYVVNREQRPRLFTLKRVFTGSIPLTGLQLLHSIHPSTVMPTWSLGRIPVTKTKKIEPLLSNKELSFLYYACQVVHNNNSLEVDKDWRYINENGSMRVIRGLVWGRRRRSLCGVTHSSHGL